MASCKFPDFPVDLNSGSAWCRPVQTFSQRRMLAIDAARGRT